MMKGFTRRFKPLEILPEEALEDMHMGVLDVHFETGVKFQNKKALELFRKHDCEVHDEDIEEDKP